MNSQIRYNPHEIWFINCKLVQDRARRWLLINLTLRIDIHEMFGLSSTIDQFDATDFDDTVSIFWIEAGGFGIKNVVRGVPTP